MFADKSDDFAFRRRAVRLRQRGAGPPAFRIVTAVVKQTDRLFKFMQRGKPYLQMRLDFHNEKGVHKATWWCSLILPATQADVARFANA